MTAKSIAERLGRHIAPPRFLLFLAALALGSALLIPALGAWRGLMAAFDIAAALFLVVIAPLFRAPPKAIRRHAKDNDANRALLLAVSAVVTLTVLIAVASELHARAAATTALVVATLALAWLFSNIIYALHYAHLYYSGDERGEDRAGLNFPGEGEPDYWDFAYFSFTLGMTFQTSDIDISSRHLRRVALVQSIAAFVFNIGVLAFTINILGGG